MNEMIGLYLSPLAAGGLSFAMGKFKVKRRLNRIPKPARAWIMRGIHGLGTVGLMALAQKTGLGGEELSMAFAVGIGVAGSAGVQVSYGVGRNGQ